MTPKQVADAAIPNPWKKHVFYPIPGKPDLDARLSIGRGKNYGKTYVIIRKPCTFRGTQLGYDYARGKLPDGEWEWV